MKKNILLIGANGYIGCMVHEALLADGYHVIGVDKQSPSPTHSPLEILGRSYQDLSDDILRSADDIICLAGHSSVKLAVGDPDGALANNFNDMIRLIRRLDRQRLIYASTSSVYSGCGNNPATENSPCYMPMNAYDFSKLAFDQYIYSHDIPAIGLRLGTVNGYSYRMRSELIINSMTYTAITKNVIGLANPLAFRPVLAMSDLVAAIVAIIESDERKGFFNLASFNMSIGNIAQAASQKLSVPIQKLDDHKTYDFTIDSSKFEKTFSFPFKGNIDNIVDDLLSHGYPHKY